MRYPLRFVMEISAGIALLGLQVTAYAWKPEVGEVPGEISTFE